MTNCQKRKQKQSTNKNAQSRLTDIHHQRRVTKFQLLYWCGAVIKSHVDPPEVSWGGDEIALGTQLLVALLKTNNDPVLSFSTLSNQ